MSNAVRGTKTAEIDGQTVTLCLSANEWCELEEEHGKTTIEILKAFDEMASKEDLDMRFLRSMFRAALSYGMPAITHMEAGRFMQAYGLVESARLLGETIKLSMPEENKTAGKPKAAKVARA